MACRVPPGYRCVIPLGQNCHAFHNGMSRPSGTWILTLSFFYRCVIPPGSEIIMPLLLEPTRMRPSAPLYDPARIKIVMRFIMDYAISTHGWSSYVPEGHKNGRKIVRDRFYKSRRDATTKSNLEAYANVVGLAMSLHPFMSRRDITMVEKIVRRRL
jgi:hypothetical protein